MHKRTYEIIGLRHWDEVFRNVLIALPLILIGFLFCYFVWWGKKAQARQEKQPYSSHTVVDMLGYLGLLIMLAGAFFLLPLFAWIEAVVSGVATFIVAIFLIVLLVGALWIWATGKWNR
jgi:hypothetical protein